MSRAEDLLDKGLTCSVRGKVDKAIQYLEEAVQVDPALSGAYTNLGILYLRRGEVERAIKMFKKNIQLKPDSINSHLELAQAYILQGEMEEAAKEYRKVLSLNPKDYRGIRGLGYIYRKQGLLDKAIGWLRMAAESNPDDLNTHFNLARAYQEKKLFQEASREWEKAVAICKKVTGFLPGKLGPYFILGKIEFLRGNVDQAIEWLEKARKLKPITGENILIFSFFFSDIDVLITLGEAYKEKGWMEKASQVAKEILRLVPGQPWAKSFLADYGKDE